MPGLRTVAQNRGLYGGGGSIDPEFIGAVTRAVDQSTSTTTSLPTGAKAGDILLSAYRGVSNGQEVLGVSGDRVSHSAFVSADENNVQSGFNFGFVGESQAQANFFTTSSSGDGPAIIAAIRARSLLPLAGGNDQSKFQKAIPGAGHLPLLCLVFGTTSATATLGDGFNRVAYSVGDGSRALSLYWRDPQGQVDIPAMSAGFFLYDFITFGVFG